MTHTASDDFVKFYSTNDLSIGLYINRIETVLKNFIEAAETNNINEIIELYNIQLFFQHKIYSRNWSEKQIAEYEQNVNKIPKTIGKFFSQIPINSLDNIFQTITYEYVEDFWNLICNYKIYDNISSDIFQKIMQNKKFYLSDVLQHKALVKKFPNEIIHYMKQHISCAEILLQYYLEQHGDKQQLYFPNTLSNEEKINILNTYISSDEANINYLELIYKSNETPELPLPDKLKLNAMRKYNEMAEDLFQNSPYFEYGVNITFSDKQEEAYKIEMNTDGILSASYSTNWIRENLDYPTLLNNFIYLFGYTDMHFRSLHTSKKSYLGIFEKIMGVTGKREYPIGIAFRQMQMYAQTQMIGYCQELKKHNIQLEEVIAWFFQEYLKDEFNANGFVYNVSSNAASYTEKCRNIIAEMDSVLKQFRLWCENKEIDAELLHISTSHIFIKDIPSMLKEKYIYPYGEDYKIIKHLLFSNQSLMHYIPDISKDCDTFYELLKKHKIYYDAFQENQTPKLDWLISHNILKIDNKKKLVPYIEKIEFLYNLFQDEVICWNYVKKHQKIIDELKEQGIIRFETSLFSKPEQDYYNYLFNKSEFDNGLDLRNQYAHGTQKDDETTNMNDYYTFLRMMILIVIKINEEFCLNQTKDMLCKSYD